MAKFNVHVYAIVRITVPGVEGENAIEAAKNAEKEIDGVEENGFYKMFQNINSKYETAYAEEIESFLVDPLDENGKVKYDETVCLDPNFDPKK
jgi:hypothetical protein